MAAIVGESRTYSFTLRGNIADTIAFLGGYAGDDRLPDGATGQEYADLLVHAITRKLSADPTGRAWQSLADVLPLLAEASPDRFLDAVEAGLAGDHPLLRLMFLDSEVATFSASSPHFSLVWALETLCWSSDHLSRAATALARLTDIDPEPHGRSNPRPAGSLANVFRLYWPQTSAPVQRRIAVIDMLRRQAPAAAWSLLLAILPAPGVGIPTHRPRWRSWAQERVNEINPAEVAAGTTQVVIRLLEDAGRDAARWTDLIGRIDSLPIGDRERVLSALESLDPDSLEDSGRVSVWRALVSLSSRHRQFAEAGWAMPGDVVDRIEDVAAQFAPASLIDLYVDLFGHHPRLPGIDPRDYTAYDGALRAARKDAASAVLVSGGVTDLLALGSVVELPRAVGWAAAEASGDELTSELLPLLGVERSDHQVAQGYAAGRIEADGLGWIEWQLQRSDVTWTTAQQAGLLLAVPRPSSRLLAIVAQRPPDVQEVFWQRVNPWLAEPDARAAMAHELIERQRPWSAITVLVGSLASSDQTGSPPDAALVELALASAGTGPSDDVQHAASLVWEVKELLDYLERVGSDAETRARLEFLFMPLLQHTRPPRALEEALQTRPELFAEIMSIVYRAETDPADQPVPPERQALAEAGYSVLSSWHTPPGVRPDGTIDVNRLRGWISEARRILAESGRRVVGDIVIGEVLAHTPADSNGLWPALPIRDLIEGLASPDLEKGLQTGKFNNRGIVTRDPASGGELERALAGQFSGWAERVADQWPRTAAMLRGLAATYETWGRREDEEAENFGDRGNYSRLSRISQIAEDQWGLVTRRQADLAGISDATLQRLISNGILERVAHEVYLMGAAMPDHLDLRATWLQLAPEVPAWERTPEQGVVSHRSAAALYGLGHLPADQYDFTFPGPHLSQRSDVLIHQRKLRQDEWIRLHGLPVTRPSRIAADLLDNAEDPEAVAHVVADAIKAVYDYPGAFVDALTPYAASFGLAPGDGLALLRWLLDLVGDPETERWMDEARTHAARSPNDRDQLPPPYPDLQNPRR